MKYSFFLYATAMVSAIAGIAPDRLYARSESAAPVTIVVGGKPVAFVVAPFVGDDGQIYAPADVVRLLGATYTPNADGRTVTITAASGTSTTVNYRFMKDRYCVPMQQIGNALGATETWDPQKRTLSLRARLLMVRQDAGSLNVYTTYPVYFRVQKIPSPNRVYVDLYGVDLAASPAEIPTTQNDVTQIRTGRIDFNTARVVIDLRSDVKYEIDAPMQTSHVRVALSGGVPGAPQPIAPTPVVPVRPPVVAARPPSTQGSELPALPLAGGQSRNVPGSAGGANGVRVTSMTVNPLSDTVTQVIIKTNGTTHYRTMALLDPNRLAIDLAGAAVDGLNAVAGDNDIVKAVRAGAVRAGKANFGRVVIDLAKIVDYSVTTQTGPEGTTYLVNLESSRSAPLSTSGALRGKIVMVDPGHGGSDSGAVGDNGAYEKNITLSISKRLYDTLRSNGATVYLTRDGDTLPPVKARPQMAIAVNADYFISVHCDSSGAVNSHSGTTIYYHKQNPVCRRMASDISRRVGEVSGIPALGTRSDTVRFQTGFGVLRGSPMPAVLVETGYINCSRDRACLEDPAIQQRIAEGITAGLIDFVAERGGE